MDWASFSMSDERGAIALPNPNPLCLRLMSFLVKLQAQYL
jgi:hypothetical protein